MCSADDSRSTGAGSGDSPASAPLEIEALSLPEWVLFHVPHDSTFIPPSVRGQFLLNDAELKAELLRMTDHSTFDLFAQDIPAERIARFPLSRLVVDVERFEEDGLEVMAALGMGAVYERTSDGRQLRHSLACGEREEIMNAWYRPHHARLAGIAEETIHRHGVALLLDAHSFPSKPLPCDLNQEPNRPDICIGTDEFHTPMELKDASLHAFGIAGWTVGLNTPFAGALVPMRHYRKEPRLAALMIEVNRGLYVDEATGERRSCFPSLARMIRKCVVSAVSTWTHGNCVEAFLAF
jgi:N-formylglutamate amidohydrolase